MVGRCISYEKIVPFGGDMLVYGRVVTNFIQLEAQENKLLCLIRSHEARVCWRAIDFRGKMWKSNLRVRFPSMVATPSSRNTGQGFYDQGWSPPWSPNKALLRPYFLGGVGGWHWGRGGYPSIPIGKKVRCWPQIRQKNGVYKTLGTNDVLFQLGGGYGMFTYIWLMFMVNVGESLLTTNYLASSGFKHGFIFTPEATN